MDGFNEKKWFIYITDHHEGPFSLADIQAKMEQSQVTSASFVWAEGMGDWRPMTSIPEFDSVIHSRSARTGTDVQLKQISIKSSPPAAAPALAAPLDEKTGDLDVADLKQAKESAVEKKSGGVRKIVKWTFIALVPVGASVAYVQGHLDPILRSPALKAGIKTVSEITQPYLLQLTERFPALGNFISPLPALDDVSADEYEGLKAVALQKLEEGARFALASSSAEPVFYVSSNLPDGASVDVHVEGISETLLNQLSFSAKTQATISKKLGKTGMIRYADDKPLPRGEYIAYVTESAQQPEAVKTLLDTIPPITAKAPPFLPKGLKLLYSKNFFLGGNKDEIYAARLKEFHDKLRAKATTELGEVKQFATTLDAQFTQTSTKFNSLRRSRSKKAWADFHKEWNNLNDQLKESFSKWTPESLQTEYFYGSLYSLTQQAGQAVEQVHLIQQKFFEGKADAKSFDIQLGTMLSGAESALSALKAKLEQAEKLSPTPNGMPRREGL